MTEIPPIAPLSTFTVIFYRYFALSMAFHLETGFSFLPYKKCEQYSKEEGESMITLRDPDAKSRYFICMWLW